MRLLSVGILLPTRILGALVGSSDGCIGTVAGVPLHEGVSGEPAVGASLKLYSAAIADPSNTGNIIIPAYSSVLLVDLSGMLSLFAGGGHAQDALVIATESSLHSRTYVASGPKGDFYIADEVSLSRLDVETGHLHRLSGNTSLNTPEISPDGSPAYMARISPYCLHADIASGDVYFCDGYSSGPGVVRVIHPQAGSLLETAAGNESQCLYDAINSISSPSIDGVPTSSTVYSDLRDVFVTRAGDILLAENDNCISPRIVHVSAVDGISRVIAGTIDVQPASLGATLSCTSPTSVIFRSGAPARGTQLLGAVAVCRHPSTDIVYFSDSYRLIAIIPGAHGAESTLRVVAGAYSGAYATSFVPIVDGTLATQATFYSLSGVREGVSADDVLLVDSGVSAVYRLDLGSGVLHAVAGSVQLTPVTAESTNGVLATSLSVPGLYDVALDVNSGDLFVPVSSGNVILRVFGENGTAIVIAGLGGPGQCSDTSGDPDASSIAIAFPSAVALDGRGGLAFSDRNCCLLRRLDLKNNSVSVLAGNNTGFCTGILDDNALANPSEVLAPVKSLGHPNYIAIDYVTGDVFWTEDLGFRVLLLRGGRGSPFRVAGTGLQGNDSNGVINDGAIALFTDLAAPGSIAIDPVMGVPVFIDGYYPGRILRLEKTGMLTVLLSIPLSSTEYPILEGPRTEVSAVLLSGLAFTNSGRNLLFADTASDSSWSIIRRLDLDTGLVTHVAGSFLGSVEDGQPVNVTRFSYITAIAAYPGGSLVFADDGSSLIRVSLSDSFTFCPAGFSCPCGRPIPCTDPKTFCPANQLSHSVVQRGYYAVAINISASLSVAANSSWTNRFAQQAACPPGFYCVGGVRLACPAGTYGTARLQSALSGCQKCAAGFYSARQGAVGISSCLPCPVGTYSEEPGSAYCTSCRASTFNARRQGNSSAACLLCSEDSSKSSLPGSSTCAPLSNQTVYSSPLSNVVAVHYVAPPIQDAQDSTPISLSVCIPIGFVSILPLIHLALVRLFCKGCCGLCRKERGLDHWQLRRWRPIAMWLGCVRLCLVRIDMFSMRHVVNDGTHPLNLRTSFGGAMSVLAIGTMLVLAVALIIQYWYANALVTTALLPAPFPTLMDLTSIRPHTAGSLPSTTSARTTRGLELTVTALGPTCGHPVFAPMGLLSGSFSVGNSSEDSPSRSWELSYVCADCSFGPLSSVSLTFPSECQAFRVLTTAIGATGGVSLCAITIPALADPPPAAAASNASSLSLASASIALAPQLEFVNDTIRAVYERGYTIEAARYAQTKALAPLEVQLYIDLSISPSYTLVNAVRITTETALLSSIIGLAGLFGFYGSVFYVIETYCVRTNRVIQEVKEVKANRQRRVSHDGVVPSLLPIITERRLSLGTEGLTPTTSSRIHRRRPSVGSDVHPPSDRISRRRPSVDVQPSSDRTSRCRTSAGIDGQPSPHRISKNRQSIDVPQTGRTSPSRSVSKTQTAGEGIAFQAIHACTFGVRPCSPLSSVPLTKYKEYMLSSLLCNAAGMVTYTGIEIVVPISPESSPQRQHRQRWPSESNDSEMISLGESRMAVQRQRADSVLAAPNASPSSVRSAEPYLPGIID